MLDYSGVNANNICTKRACKNSRPKIKMLQNLGLSPTTVAERQKPIGIQLVDQYFTLDQARRRCFQSLHGSETSIPFIVSPVMG